MSELLIFQGDGTTYGPPFLIAGTFDKWPLPEAIRPKNLN